MDTLVIVNLRGGADGLNMVVPHGDGDYAGLRPLLSVPRASVLDLDGFFGLHPALSPLLPLYRDGDLALVHAVGWPGDTNHSHFEAWDEIESGASGDERPRSGWLARALFLRGDRGALPAVVFGDTLPRLAMGAPGTVLLRSLADHRLALPEPGPFRTALARLHGESALPIRESATATFRALDTLAKLARHAEPASGYPRTRFGRELAMIGQLVNAEIGVAAAVADLGGWDTHFLQGVTQGPMPSLLAELSSALAAFTKDVGPRWKRVAVLVHTEFGRRASENGSGGTDHGQGGVALLAGGSVRGGRVAGVWPGLSPGALSGPGDLAITTDLRELFAEAVAALVGDDAGMNAAPSVFPCFTPKGGLELLPRVRSAA